MAYGLKYKFKFEATHGIIYEVRLLEDGFSGTAKQRPLGKAPVIHMQENGPFRATSVDLVLECQDDGEYVDLYTSDPRQYKVQIYRGTTSVIWEGFIATELYSEPDIAPPYDVKVTATDGLGVLKEYDFQAGWGARTVREQFQTLLAQTGLTLDMFTVSRLREYGEYTYDFLDVVKIDLDYMDGKNCYDVLGELLTTLRCTVTQWRDAWLVIRDVDLNGQIQSDGDVSLMDSDKNGVTSTYMVDKDHMTAVVGKMGATGTDMWPIGYLTRRIVPAKKSITVRSDWHYKNGFPSVADNGWTLTGGASYNSSGHYVEVGGTTGSYDMNEGVLAASVTMSKFVTDIKVTVKVSAKTAGPISYMGSTYMPKVKVVAGWTVGGTTYYYSPEYGWSTAHGADGEEIELRNTNDTHDINLSETIETTFPSKLDTNSGFLTINVRGAYIDVFDITAVVSGEKGYEDTILLQNGARGNAEQLDISGGRVIASNSQNSAFYQGIFLEDDGTPITEFSDSNYIMRDFMTLTTLAYAKQHAASRIEISGRLDFPSALTFQPLLLKSHNVWALVSRYDWDLYESEISFTAVTLPTATLTVGSETIKTIPNN